MNAPTDTTPRPRPRLLRLQFSLRALLIAILILAVAIGLLTSHYRKKERAIARLRELGASIVFDYQLAGVGVVLPDADLPGNRALRRILGEHFAAYPVQVELFAGITSMIPEQFTDDDAALLVALPSIDWLVLQDTKLTNDGLMHLAGITSLRRLDIERTLVTADGVKAFRAARPDVDVYPDTDFDIE